MVMWTCIEMAQLQAFSAIDAQDCKSVNPGSIPGVASKFSGLSSASIRASRVCSDWWFGTKVGTDGSGSVPSPGSAQQLRRH